MIRLIRKISWLWALLAIISTACQKEKISLSDSAHDEFYVESNGAAMHTLVSGNTASGVFLVFVHGGPGSSSLYYQTDYVHQHLENDYACVYWDQRNAGASQGTSNANYLTLDQCTQDLSDLLAVLKYRYGPNIEIFLMGHSFGSLLTADFLIKPDNQQKVKGWIGMGATVDYPKNDTLTRSKLLSTGLREIQQGHHASDWQPIVDYCQSHSGNFSLDESQQLETYSHTAEDLIDSITPVNYIHLATSNAVNLQLPLSSLLFNYLYTQNSEFNKSLYTTSLTNELSQVDVPTLLLYGKYDFTCPSTLGNSILQHLQSTDKSMAISDISGHGLLWQDPAFFCNQVRTFIEEHR